MKNRTLHWLYTVPGKRRGYVLLLAGIEALHGASGVLYALFLRSMVDGAVRGDRAAFTQGALSLILLVLGQLLLRALLRYFYERSRAELENIFKSRLFSVLLRKDFGAVQARHSGEWMNRLTNDTKLVAETYTEVLPGAIGMLVKLISAFILLLTMDARFALLLLPFGLSMGLVALLLRGRLKALHKNIQEKDGALRSFFQERLGAMLLLRAFSAGGQSEAAAGHFLEEHRKARMRRLYFSNLGNIGLGLVVQGLYVFAAIWCAAGILNGRISYGTLTAITQLMTQIQAPFVNISAYLPRWYAMLASAERLMEAEGYADEAEGALRELAEEKRFYAQELRAIAFERVSFSYPDAEERGTDALSEASLTIRKGEITALTGQSGCGKSTLLKLLLCVYQPTGGSVKLLTEKGARPVTAKDRRLFAYVPQGNLLLHGSIREAVSFSEPERSEDDAALWEALRVACAEGFVKELGEGLDTKLGERGAGLSEGQLQRLAIARAVFSESPILLLDEATASLDGETEARFLQNVKALRDKTVIIVTHRPAALAICDRVYHFSEEGIS